MNRSISLLRPRKRKAEFRNIMVDFGQCHGKEAIFLGGTHSLESCLGIKGGERKGSLKCLFHSSKLNSLLDRLTNWLFSSIDNIIPNEG